MPGLTRFLATLIVAALCAAPRAAVALDEAAPAHASEPAGEKGPHKPHAKEGPHEPHDKPAAHPAEHGSAAAAISRGATLFARNCAGCHGARAEGKVGPNLAASPHTAEEMRRFVTRGIPPEMPSFEGKLSDREIEEVIAFVKSIQPVAGEHAAEGHAHGMAAAMGGMGMTRVPGQEMSRRGSGTSWLPLSSPIWAKMSFPGRWMIMQHGDLKVMYDAQSGPRGVSRLVSSNWYMLMGQRPLGSGELVLRTMLSLEAATFGNNGQPQLFQTGEGLIDRQHPHDLFMEIAAQYSQPIGKDLGAYIYLAPVGEPALGPVAFMHRPSAMEIPTAPLIHHWTDSSHISYGVITAGIQSRRWKLEGSWFNGHEPDSKRWAIDPLGLNSYAGRLSYAPGPNWAFQVSHGRVDNPELNYPGLHQGDVDRTTFSASHNRPLPRGNWATTFVWGRNRRDEGSSDGFLLESNYNWADRNYIFGRIERVDKDELYPPGHPRAERQFLVNSLSLGYARDLGRSKNFETALGAMATVYAKSSELDRTYGDFPVGFQVFLRVRPRRMKMAADADHGDAMHHARLRPAGQRLRMLLAAHPVDRPAD